MTHEPRRAKRPASDKELLCIERCGGESSSSLEPKQVRVLCYASSEFFFVSLYIIYDLFVIKAGTFVIKIH